MKTLTKPYLHFIILLLLASCNKNDESLIQGNILNYEMSCINGSSYFYYTFDYERIYLDLSPLCITIKFTEKVDQDYFDYLVEKNDGLDSITYINTPKNIAFGWLSKNVTCKMIKAILINLSKESKTVSVNPNFILKQDNPIGNPISDIDELMGLTDEIIVKLKTSVPTSFIDSLVSATQSKIVKETSLYLIISADKYSTRNSLELSRLFYETDKFVYSCPNFLIAAPQPFP
jgi:hypothetical protein